MGSCGGATRAADSLSVVADALVRDAGRIFQGVPFLTISARDLVGTGATGTGEIVAPGRALALGDNAGFFLGNKSIIVVSKYSIFFTTILVTQHAVHMSHILPLHRRFDNFFSTRICWFSSFFRGFLATFLREMFVTHSPFPENFITRAKDLH